MTWVQCFVTYAAVVAKAHPHRMRDLIAYLHMIVREAQRHGGDAWRSYNVLFRKIATPNSVIRWEQPLPSLYATSFLAARASAAASCENCSKGDHKSKECALSPVTTSLSKSGGFEQSAPYHTPRRSSAEGNGRAVGPGFADRPTCKKCNFSPSGCKGYLSCSYWHTCLRCGLHSLKVGECRDMPTSAVVKELAQVDRLSAKRE